jgi:hypothetical protein
MIDVQGLLQNLTSLQLNTHLYANHHHIHQIVARRENGVWAVCEQFPRTIFDFVTLNRRFGREEYFGIFS